MFFTLLASLESVAATPAGNPFQHEKSLATFYALENSTQPSTNNRISGWVGTPNARGTWDIVWTCMMTVFVCTYTLLCLNVPAPNESTLHLILRRVKWMVLAIVAPEIVLTYAAGQWSRAKYSVEAFRSSGFNEWTMRMAFFADMGGFVLCANESKPFPLNAKQLHWLVVNKHIPYPKAAQGEVWDKSKQDRLARVISTFQVGYLIVDCIARAVQNLAITTLELNTLGIVVYLIGQKKWRTTPLDFVDENGPGWSMNVQSFMGMPVIPPERPIERIPNDRFPTNPYGIQEYCLCFATLLFTGIHVLGWNFSFPTEVEKTLWKVSSLILSGVTGAFWLLETIASWSRLGRWKRLYLRVTDPNKLPEWDKSRADRSMSGLQREMTEIPVPWEFWTIMPVAVLYGLARLCMLVEGFTSLREVDPTTYDTVDWSIYIPHI
ncbi:hypothetical protein GQ53DRAFT_635171 [Thozetella sp. PMI_491]|nr:hypothetical protein GQ53DRAFT_635171 [Thozetella sp. PMI_491]